MLSERDSHLGIAELLLFWKFQKRKGWNLSSHQLITPVPPEMLSVYNAFPYGAKTDNSLAVKMLYCVMEEADAFCWVVHLICSIQEALFLSWIFAKYRQICLQWGIKFPPPPQCFIALNLDSKHVAGSLLFTAHEGQSLPHQFPFSLHNCFSHGKNTFYNSLPVCARA